MTGGALQPRRPWKGRRIVLGVTGGIAAYKVVQLARDLTRLGAQVDVVMTRAAQEFVAPLSFEGVTGRPVSTELFSAEGAARHVMLGREAEVMCVAPATADFIARAAQGRADDLLTTTLLATAAQVVVVPAMNDRMFAHPQTRANLDHLRDTLGYTIVGPAVGPLAAGEGEGPGRMVDPGEIVEHLGRALATDEPFRDSHVLITAGPTREPVDPVRYVGNRSSGRMGFAVAGAAWRRGARVTLISGPSALDDPVGVDAVRVDTAEAMRDAVAARLPEADVVVFAAAVSDYRPSDPRDLKIKRSATGDSLVVEMTANPDIAGDTRAFRKPGAVVVGFALETSDLIEHARGKLESKAFDLIVANNATEPGSGFEVDTNRVTLIESEGAPAALPLMSKDDVAEVILDRVATHLSARA